MKRKWGSMLSLSLAAMMVVSALPAVALAEEPKQNLETELLNEEQLQQGEGNLEGKNEEKEPDQEEKEGIRGDSEEEKKDEQEDDKENSGENDEDNTENLEDDSEEDFIQRGDEKTEVPTAMNSILLTEQPLAEAGVAAIDEETFDTLQAAIDEAGTEETEIVLGDNITAESVTIGENQRIILNLNGFSIANEEGKHTITNEGNLTIIGEGVVDNISHQKAALWNEPGGTVILEGGTYTRSLENGSNAAQSGGNSYYNIVNHGTMTIRDGVTVEQEGGYSSLIENGWYNGNENTGETPSIMIIEGGTFSGGLNTVKNDDYGELEIKDGTFDNIAQAAVLNWNVTTISGGEFTVNEDADAVVLNGKLDDTMDQGELNVEGGTFAGADGAEVDFLHTMQDRSIGQVTITGGDISGDIVLTDNDAGGVVTITDGAVMDGNITNEGIGGIAVTDGAQVTGGIQNTSSGNVTVTNATVGAIENIGTGKAEISRSTIQGSVTGGENATTNVVGSTVEGYDNQGSNQYVTYVNSVDGNQDSIVNEGAEGKAAMIDGNYYDTLKDAVEAAQSGDTIYLVANAEVTNNIASPVGRGNAVISLPNNVTLDGGGYSIIAADDWISGTGEEEDTQYQNSVVGIANTSGAVIRNVTIIGNASTKHGINAWGNNGNSSLTVENVTIQDCGNAGMVINGADVTAKNIHTEGNAWGGVNVDDNADSRLTLTGGSFGEDIQIWSEQTGNDADSNISVTVDDLDTVTGVKANGETFTYYTDDVSKLDMDAYVGDTVYESFEDALESIAATGGTVGLLRDTSIDQADITITGDVTITGTGTIIATVAGSTSQEAGNVAFDINGDGSLTLDGEGLEMIVQGFKTAEGNNNGTAFELVSGTELTVQNGAQLTLKDLERGVTMPGSPLPAGGTVTVDNAVLDVDNIDGNFSNGGNFVFENNAQVTIDNCGSFGISANNLTVDNADLTINNAGISAIYATKNTSAGANDVGTFQVINGGTVTVTNSGSQLHFASQWSEAEAPIELGQKLGPVSLTVDEDSSITLTNNVDKNGNANNAIHAGGYTTLTLEGDITGTVILDEEIPAGMVRIVFVSYGGEIYDVQTVAVAGGQATFKEPDGSPSRNGYRFRGWNYSTATVTNGATNNTKVLTVIDGTEEYTFSADWRRNSTSSSGSGGGSSSSGTYDVEKESTANGSFSVSDSRADRYDTVTITARPDDGYVVDEVIVTDEDGNEITVRDGDDENEFTFRMPRGDVHVKVTFEAEGTEDQEQEEEEITETPVTMLPFTDVTDNDWFKGAVEYVYENGLMSDISSNQFGPSMNTTRGMIVTILYRLEGSPTGAGRAPFADVAADAYYADAVAWASVNNIVSGYDALTFGPEDNITREQMASILYRYAAYKGLDMTTSGSLAAFTDNASVSGWANTAAVWVVDNGILSGRGNNTLAPQENATRAEVASIFMRYCENLM